MVRPNTILAAVAVPLLAFCLHAGCFLDPTLPDPKPVEGKRLVRGRSIDNPVFRRFGEATWILYQTPHGDGSDRRANVDISMVSVSTGQNRVLATNVSSDRSHQLVAPGSETFFFFVDGRRSNTGARVFTLLRVDALRGELQRIEDVVGVTPFQGGEKFLYQKQTPDSLRPELHLRLPDGSDQIVGRVSGQVQYVRDDRIYFVEGDDQSLVRWDGPEKPLERLRARVAQYQWRPDGKQLLLTVTDGGRTQTLVFDPVTRMERKLPVSNPLSFGFSGSVLIFVERANPAMDAVAKLHRFNTDTGEDHVQSLPKGLQDLAGLPRPHPHLPGTLIYTDSRGHMVLTKEGEEPRVLAVAVVAPEFTPDGKSMLYVEPATELIPGASRDERGKDGYLMQIAADFSGAPERISPPGSFVPLAPRPGFFFVGGDEPLVFWARFGPGAADLYFATLEPRKLRVAAQSISEVSVSASQIFGIIRVSIQDLTGDLVRRNAKTGDEIVYEHNVTDFITGPDPECLRMPCPALLAFTVRERSAQERDGLWLMRLDTATGERVSQQEPRDEPMENPPSSPIEP